MSSAFKKRIFVETILSSQSMVSSFASNAYDMRGAQVIGVRAIFTGSPVGTVWISGSDDGVVYTTIGGTTAPINGADNIRWGIANPDYNWIKINYSATSSTGSMSATLNYKGD